MSFDENAGLDTSQVEDSRGFGGIPGGGIAIGGGAGLLLAILGLIFGGNFLGGGSGGTPAPADNGALSQSCRSGADANARADCRVVATVNSVQAYWKSEFTRRGRTYRPAKTRLFTQATST